MNHKMLITFIFSPHDGCNNDFSPYCLFAVVDGGSERVDAASIEDSLASFFEADTYYDTDEEAVDEVLMASGYHYHFVDEYVPECDDGVCSICV